MQNMSFKNYAFIAIVIVFLMACGSEQSASELAPVETLSSYETAVSYEDGVLANPKLLRQGPDGALFVYDAGSKQVIRLDSQGNKLQTFGGAGRGPGEFIRVNNMFLAQGNLYVVDRIQYRISRFDLDGNLTGTFRFGEKGSQALPPPGPQGGRPLPSNITNQPAVTLNGNVLTSAVKPNGTTNLLYRLVGWEGTSRATLGAVPEGSSFSRDIETYEAAVEEEQIPAYLKPKAFPVMDASNPGELFLVYRVLGNIVKYDTAGSKKWEVSIPHTPEIDSLTADYYATEQESRKSWISLNKYVAGRTTSNGDLFLAKGEIMAAPTNSVWIHRFNSSGDLIKRYKLTADEVKLVPIFTVDEEAGKILLVTEEAEIRSYKM